MKKGAKAGVDLESMKEEIDSVDKLAQRLHDMAEVEAINVSSQPRVMRRGDTTEIKPTMKEPKRFAVAGAAGTGALALVFLLVAYWEFLARRIISGEDVAYGLGWRVVGAIPDLPNRHRRKAVAGADEASKHWSSLLTESVDALRAVILRSARTEGLRTIMITSAVAGEGKTSVSCHLATSLARAGRKTILIDCDLRRPSVHQLFDMPVDPGLCDVLRGGVDLDGAMRSTVQKNLWLIPAGHCDNHSLEVLAQDGILPVLERLKEQFEFVLVDTSPVLPVSDVLLVGQHVDGVIFSVLSDVSRFPNVYTAYERLAGLGIRILGAVVNGVRQNRSGYAYQYYYSNHYSNSRPTS